MALHALLAVVVCARTVAGLSLDVRVQLTLDSATFEGVYLTYPGGDNAVTSMITNAMRCDVASIASAGGIGVRDILVTQVKTLSGSFPLSLTSSLSAGAPPLNPSGQCSGTPWQPRGDGRALRAADSADVPSVPPQARSAWANSTAAAQARVLQTSADTVVSVDFSLYLPGTGMDAAVSSFNDFRYSAPRNLPVVSFQNSIIALTHVLHPQEAFSVSVNVKNLQPYPPM